jgi:predicted dithiol-disulfide oxidoreductase (DUF899 family)
MATTAAVSRETWLRARKALLAKEKKFTRLRDELSASRRALPRVRIDKDYVFEGPKGPVSLAQLFEGRSQLVVYHFMFGPDWKEGCPSCSFWSDHFDAAKPHLNARDVSFAVVSRAPLKKFAPFKRRMGWKFPWVSSHANDFNYDFDVAPRPGKKGTYNFAPSTGSMSELPGLSVFCRDKSGAIYHTYSCYARGLDMLNGTYQLLDLVPQGRDEAGLPWPMAWVRYHDRYGLAKKSKAKKRR